ncbi:hypothetical protein [Pedobacter sp. BS3]|uniref:hypothetical protein n=1 Tax=Pedobacter sp. BS3 TaxID=2567937 RepID=UPI0011EC2C26|nr:hypothetical protein [Pedobacter sp. BS3]
MRALIFKHDTVQDTLPIGILFSAVSAFLFYHASPYTDSSIYYIAATPTIVALIYVLLNGTVANLYFKTFLTPFNILYFFVILAPSHRKLGNALILPLVFIFPLGVIISLIVFLVKFAIYKRHTRKANS